MGRPKPVLDACRPAGGRAHCLRFANPAEATRRPEARKFENSYLGDIVRRLDGSLEVLMRVLVLCGLLASKFHFPLCKNLLDPRDPDSALFC